MLALTRLQRQIGTTLALLALTVAPTALVIAWAWQVNRPGHVRDVEVELGRRLGLQVSLEGVRHPTPTSDELRGVVLREEEPGTSSARLAELVRAERVRIVRGDDRVALTVRGLRLSASGPEEAVGLLETLIKRLGASARRVDLVASDAVVEIGGAHGRLALPLDELVANLRVERERSNLSASARVDAKGGPSRCEMQLTRALGEHAPSLALRFQTMDGAVPAATLAPLFDADGWLGPDAEAAGTMEWSRVGDAWEGTFRGALIGVDLAALVGDRFPEHRLEGRARLDLVEACWGPLPAGQGVGWTVARGTLRSGPGVIGADLLRALARELRFRVQEPLVASEEVAFASLGLAFRLDKQGEIDLEGALGPELAPAAVLASADRLGTLARVPEGSANVRALWKALVPWRDDVLVPATPEAQVFRYLPLPASGAELVPTVRAN